MFPVEQALYGSRGSEGYHFLARSAGFREEWLGQARELCTRFGELPPGTRCPEALFVQPLDRHTVALVRVADRGKDDSGRPSTLAFHLLALEHQAYRDLGGDPFLLAEQFPPVWSAEGELPTLTCPPEGFPRRRVEDLQQVLKQAHGPTLLGAAQALVDGGRFVAERQEPEPRLLRDLWSLLPTRSRGDLWPATFAVGNALDFHAAAVPRLDPQVFASHVTEAGAGDYPEGRYELALQIAVESASQTDLDRVLSRRTAADTRKLMLWLLGASLAIILLVNWFSPPDRPVPPPDAPPGQVSSALDIPKEEECRPLSGEERDGLTKKLLELGRKAKAGVTPDMTAEQLVVALDEKLGTPDPRRQGSSLANVKPVERQLRVLLYKHGVAEYNDRRLNTLELTERLERKLNLAPERMP